MTGPQNKGNIMVVDDQPANLKLLEDMLRQQGYEVRSFPRGRLALAAAVQHPPDLVLLDINMPEMDGYDVCRRMKSDGKLAGVPVIFLSALDETEGKVQAFRSGGVDYITKPFQFDEVQVRVETQLQLHRLQAALQSQNHRLEELVSLRTRELADAHARLKVLDKAKSDFLSLISHELRTPLNGVLGIGQLLLDGLGSSPEDHQLGDMFEVSRQRILVLLEDALLLSQIEVEGEKFASRPLALAAVLGRAIDRTAEFAKARQVILDPAPPDVGFVVGTEDLMTKALQSLLETAVKFSKAGEVVRLACPLVRDAVCVVIDSRSGAIPASAIPKFFDLFSIGEADTQAAISDWALRWPIAFWRCSTPRFLLKT